MAAHPGPHPVLHLLRRVSVASHDHAHRIATDHGLGRTDLRAMTAMAEARVRGGQLTAGELATTLGLSPSATTSLLDRMERMGHVERVHDDHDRRRIVVTLTPAAAGEAREMFGPLAARIAELLPHYTEDELQVVERFLRDAADAIDTLDRE